MNNFGRIPFNSTTPFAPSFDPDIEYLTNLNATCDGSTGIVTITWDDPIPPFNSSAKIAYLQVGGYSSFTYDAGAVNTLTSVSPFPNYHIVTNQTGENIGNFDGTSSNLPLNPYESGTGLANPLPNTNWSSRGNLLYHQFSDPGVLSLDINISELNQNNTTEAWRVNGPLTSGNLRLWCHLAVSYAYEKYSAESSTVRYHSKWQYVDVALSGPDINAPVAPTPVTNFSIDGRAISWDDDTTNAAYYIIVYKWNGSSWDELRRGYLADGYSTYGTGSQRYTIPDGDGSGTFYIAISTTGVAPIGTFSAYAISSSYTI